MMYKPRFDIQFSRDEGITSYSFMRDILYNELVQEYLF